MREFEYVPYNNRSTFVAASEEASEEAFGKAAFPRGAATFAGYPIHPTFEVAHRVR